MSKSAILLFFFINACNFLLYGQEVPEIVHFSKGEYNAANQNWMFAQGCDGLIYVANSDGVLIYNGYSWRLVKLKDSRRPRAVFKGKDCKIYTGGYETFGYLDMGNPARPYFVDISDTLIKNTKEEIWNIFGNDQDIVFQSFADVYLYDYEKVKHVRPPTNIMLGATVNDQLYIPKIEQGLYRLEESRFAEVKGGSAMPERSKITAIVGDVNGGLTLATQYGGVFILDMMGQLSNASGADNEIWKQEEINKMIRLSDGNFAIGTILNGLYIVDAKMKIKYHISKQNGLSNNTVLSLFEDKDGNIWVGLDKGINVIRYQSNSLFYYDKQGLLGTVYAALKTRDKFYLGTNQGVFVRPEGGTFSFIPGTQGQVWSLLEVGHEVLCGHNSGTFLIDGQDKARLISDVTGGWDMQKINDTTILQTTYTGMVLFKKRSNGAWTFGQRVGNGARTIERFEVNGQTLMTYHAHDGLGLMEMTPGFDSVLNVSYFPQLLDEAVSPQVLFFVRNTDFVILNGKNTFNCIDGRISPMVDTITDSRYGYYEAVLRLTNGGQSFNAHRNLMPHGLILTSNDDGYQILPYKEDIKYDSVRIDIDYALVNNEVHTFNEKGNNALNANENDFVFYLKQIGGSFESTKVFYQLNGWDEDWYDVPKDGILSFRNLNDGTYTLMIKYGEELPRPMVSFIVKPHWYESWIGFCLLAVLLSGGFWYFDKWHDRNLEREKEKLRKEKELELSTQIMQAENEKLEHEVTYKAKMLANSTMTLVQKNNMLNELKEVISKEEITEANKKKWQQKVLHLIDKNLSSDEEWAIFEQNFDEVHEEFLQKLSSLHPELTSGELKLAAYIRMDLSSKEIAPLFNISLRSVENKRYRLRKRLGLEHDDNLSSYLLKM